MTPAGLSSRALVVLVGLGVIVIATIIIAILLGVRAGEIAAFIGEVAAAIVAAIALIKGAALARKSGDTG